MGLIVIGLIIGSCMLAGFLLKKWTPTTVEGKVEKKVAEEVVEEVLAVEEPKI